MLLLQSGAYECATTHAASSSLANYGRCETTLNYGKLIMKVNTNDADQDGQIEKDDVMQQSTSQIILHRDESTHHKNGETVYGTCTSRDYILLEY